MALTTIIAIIALIGAVLVCIPRVINRPPLWGFALVLVCLAAAMYWYEDFNTGERWAFWIVFAIMAFHTIFPHWGDRSIGAGILMAAFTAVLILFDITGWVWWIFLILALVLLFFAVLYWAVKYIWVVIGAVLVLWAVSFVANWISDLGNETAAPKAGVTKSAPPTGGATATASPTTASCPPAYVQTPYDRGDKNRMLKDGIATLLRAGKNATPAEKLDAYLKATGHDATLLAAYAWSEGVWTGPNDTKPLLTKDGKCLSAQGQKVHDLLEGAWKSGRVQAANTPTPTNGTNSGISHGKVVVSSQSGMDKGRTGLKIQHPNGRATFIDDACGNLVFLETPPKSVPKGPTDQPKLEAKNPSQDSMLRSDRPAAEKGMAPAVSSGASTPAAGTPPSTPYVAPTTPVAVSTATATVSPEASASPSTSPEPSGDPCNTVPKPSYC